MEFINHLSHRETLPLNIMEFQHENVFPSPSLHPNYNNNFDRKRKSLDIISTNTLESNSSPRGSDDKKKDSASKEKRVKRNGKDRENPMDVVHVRAKRGQATDSHSLAERVRRGKINERLRCLQDIVPGCYKTMGMAVMLDEIINYVQSLQSQVEFLSMKLRAVSTSNEFILNPDVIETMQRAKALETMKIHSPGNLAPLDMNNLCYFPQ